VKTQAIIGVALLSAAAILFGIGVPASDTIQPCPRDYGGNNNCFYEKQLPISLLSVALAIGGIGLFTLNHFEHHRELKGIKTDV
jgi:hypothetical protein